MSLRGLLSSSKASTNDIIDDIVAFKKDHKKEVELYKRIVNEQCINRVLTSPHTTNAFSNSVENASESSATSSRTGFEPNVTLLQIQSKPTPITCYYDEVDSNAKTVLLFPRGEDSCMDYFRRTIQGQFRDLLAGMKLNLIICEYRKLVNGCIDLLSTVQNDIHQIFKGITKHKSLRINPKNLTVIGRGVTGSLVACEFAKSYSMLQGLILESPVAQVTKLIPRATPGYVHHALPYSHEQIEAAINYFYNQCEKIQRYSGRLLILHSKQDTTVHLDHAEELYQSAGSRSKGLVIFDEGNHRQTFQANFVEYVEALVEFLKSCDHVIPQSFESLLTMLDEIRLYDEISEQQIGATPEEEDTMTDTDIWSDYQL